jgi:disulfide bond formation protein DsbB
MSTSTNVMTNIFVLLALLADAFVVWVALSGVLYGARVRAPFQGTAAIVGVWCRPLAVAVAATCMAGSLYYSEVVGFVPCQLCWYQRFVMYPLVFVLALGLWPRLRRATWWIALGMAVVGAGVALYHWLVERIPALAETSACSLTTPCSVPWFTRLGFITIAWMSLSGFLAVAALLACEASQARRGARNDGDASARLQPSVDEGTNA